MIDAVTGAFHSEGKKVLVILNIGGVIETASWRKDADALLVAWQPGQEAGQAASTGNHEFALGFGCHRRNAVP